MVDISKVTMPKWGLSMTEGRVMEWLVPEGDDIAPGDEVVEAESEKIAGAVEVSVAGVLRRQTAAVGDVVPVGGLLGVIAPADVADEDIDAFVVEFQATFVPPEEGEDTGPQPQTVEIGGRRLRYLAMGPEEGDTPLLFLHGFGGDLNNWLFNTETLSADRVTYALDLPGHGESTKDVGGFGDLVAAVDGFIDHLGLSAVHLVGHSMGGAVALSYAADNPDRVGSLTLIDSAGLGPDINDEYINGFIKATGRKDLKPLLRLLFAADDLVTRQMVDDVLKFKRKDGVQPALQTLADEVFPGGKQSLDLCGTLDALDVPVEVIWGSDDQIIPSSHAHDLPDGVAVEILDGQGHSPHMEAANRVNSLITELLRP